MIRRGTHHFRSVAEAERYYRPYIGAGLDAATRDAECHKRVRQQLADGETVIGPPEVPEGCVLGVDAEGRYWIGENEDNHEKQ